MKMTKKLFAAMLCFLMVFGMVTSVAAEGESTTNPGEITIENPVKISDDQETYAEYKAYQIFAVTYDTSKSTYAYTIPTDSPWLAVFADENEGVHVSNYGGLTLDVLADDDSIYNVVPTEDFNAVEFAALLNSKLATLTGVTAIEFESAEGKLVADNLPLGYYFVTSTSGSLCNLTTTNPEVTIYDKNDMSFDKEDDQVDVQIGQTVNYELTSKVPNTLGYEEFDFELEDTLSTGLTFNTGSVKVFVDGAEITEHYTLTEKADGRGFTLLIDVTEYQDKVSKEIKVTYSADVNADALDIEYNKATLKYENNPVEQVRYEYVFTMRLGILKVEAGDANKKLENAKFVLRNSEGKYYKLVYAGEEVSPCIHVCDETCGDPCTHEHDANCEYAVETKDTVKWVDDIADATVGVSNANGEVVAADGEAVFRGLANGSYQLIETEAPLGYNKLTAPVDVNINVAKTNEPADDSGDELDFDAGTFYVSATVENNTGSELPGTGGIGTTIFYVLGGGLMLAAVVLLVVKKRMSVE